MIFLSRIKFVYEKGFFMTHLFSTVTPAALSLALALSAPCQAAAQTPSYGPGQALEEARQADAQRTAREKVRRESPDYLAYQEQAALTLPVLTFDVTRFVLPDEAKVLVVVEGTEGSACDVYVYEKNDGGWQLQTSVAGRLGLNGMNSRRVVGDKTTPIGVFKLNTPFGQAPSQSGFPKDYVQVDGSYVWSDDTNRLEKDSQASGERVGTEQYLDYYDYVLDMGFNPEAIPGQGSALFLHCEGDYWTSSSGCVAIPREKMESVMKLYGTWGEGRCFIALAPGGTFDAVYDTYGTNHGLSPAGYEQQSRESR